MRTEDGNPACGSGCPWGKPHMARRRPGAGEKRGLSRSFAEPRIKAEQKHLDLGHPWQYLDLVE